jgi:hypothetical protein
MGGIGGGNLMGRQFDVRAQWERVRAIRADVRAARARSEQLVGMLNQVAGTLDESRRQIEALGARVDQLVDQTAAEHERTMLALRIVRDDDARAWERLWSLRRTDDYERAFTDPEPLVTIISSTYTNWRLLRERALPSVLAQTYENFECLVIGDAAPPEAAAAVESFGDPRLKFINLPYRGPYPPDREDAWFISGTTPFNTALALARGRWIGAVADDDALSSRYLESLLSQARSERAEVAYGQLRLRIPDGPDDVIGVFPPAHGHWGLQASLLHSGLRYLPLQPSDWMFKVPNDWSWAERALRIGVRFSMLEEIMVDYYPSLAWTDRPPIT